MLINWIEIYKESRGMEISRDSVSKEFVFILTSDDFVEEAATQIIPGTDLEIWLDETGVVQEMFRVFGTVIPLVFQMYITEFDYVLLYPGRFRVDQLNWRQWKITVTYDIPPDNGQSQGGGGGDTGPHNGEYNSNEFTQISFNTSVDWQQREVAVVKECQRATGLPGSPLYTLGTLQPVGVGRDEIKGYESPTRSFTFEITQYMHPSKFTTLFMRKVARLTTCINQLPFMGFAPYSVMLMGGGASGHLYQSIPVTIQFEVRTNFKLTAIDDTTLAPLVDVYTYNSRGQKVINTNNQYDLYHEPGFPGTTINSTGPNVLAGVHSGWSIIDYRYAEEIKTTEKAITRKPTDRIIFLPEEIIIADFTNLGL